MKIYGRQNFDFLYKLENGYRVGFRPRPQFRATEKVFSVLLGLRATSEKEAAQV